ncbi:hypothetical protein [Alkalicoccus urumqiensis]|uniref:Uncharacterized protein n=1 Tax=Alkalicoccus urumqiensis TaxID=1548213 RepID=A0A2P6MJK2_ALKUR|nr:hypothetical protein [Alkalicoccus urumqiensis]PRO66443.1 hypothetical protein C6I21_03635 [Alkalicoccus urumqiensis]
MKTLMTSAALLLTGILILSFTKQTAAAAGEAGSMQAAWTYYPGTLAVSLVLTVLGLSLFFWKLISQKESLQQ